MRSSLLLLAVAATWPAAALADSDKTLDYRYESVWSGAIRLIRADKGYPIKDKDRENGYVLFVYPGTGAVKECSAALQVIRIVDDRGFRKVRAKLSIEHQPSYLEVQFLDDLDRKLHEEFGSPPPPEREPGKTEPPPPKEPPKK